MALLSLQVVTRSTPHFLRCTPLLLLVPGSLILFIHGLIAHHAVPAIGIIPLFFSALYAALLLYNERKCGCLAGGLMGTPFHLAADLVLGGGMLVCFVCGCVVLGEGYHYDAGLVVLGTWGTVFLAVGFFVHLYFVGMQLWDALAPGSRWPVSCPQCQGQGFSFTFGYDLGQIKLPERTVGLKNGYAPLLDEGEPRVSGEDDGQTNEAGHEMV